MTDDTMNKFGLSAWYADGAPGKPVCIATEDDTDISLSLFMENNRIVGVRVDDLATGEWLDCGKIPVEAQIKALELQISDLKRQLSLF